MKISRLLAPTLRENPNEAELISHRLMLRAGYIRKLAAGIYNFLPLAVKVLHKIETIVRQEMDRAGAEEVLLPALSPAELWQETGRLNLYGKELMIIFDRHEREFCLGPTHEEVITSLVRHEVKSYKELPLTLYQIQTKFRDEIRPRFGLMRAREFIMKDAYSFDKDEAGLDKTYQVMDETYRRIFDRCGLRYKVVEADSGAIGGGFSEEFMVLAESGEEAIVSCQSCDYAASLDVAEVKDSKLDAKSEENVDAIKKVSTPNVKTIEELEKFFKVSPKRFIKTLIYQNGDEIVVVLLRGDHELSEAKLKRYLKSDEVLLADEKIIEAVTGAPQGFAGPVGIKKGRVLADFAVKSISDAITGANEKDFHLEHVVYGRDYEVSEIVDLRIAQEKDACARCGTGAYEICRGIEVGHIFKLGTKYSAKMKAEFLDDDGKLKPFVMGCYGIGISRIAAAAIEQCHDHDGIIWPLSLTPYTVAVVPVQIKDEAQRKTAEKIYEELLKKGIETVLDDRDERLGVRLKDIDLMGFPLKVIVGPKGLVEGKVELKKRDSREALLVDLDQIVAEIHEKYLTKN